jgi:hypothetical protein
MKVTGGAMLACGFVCFMSDQSDLQKKPTPMTMLYEDISIAQH